MGIRTRTRQVRFDAVIPHPKLPTPPDLPLLPSSTRLRFNFRRLGSGLDRIVYRGHVLFGDL